MKDQNSNVNKVQVLLYDAAQDYLWNVLMLKNIDNPIAVIVGDGVYQAEEIDAMAEALKQINVMLGADWYILQNTGKQYIAVVAHWHIAYDPLKAARDLAVELQADSFDPAIETFAMAFDRINR